MRPGQHQQNRRGRGRNNNNSSSSGNSSSGSSNIVRKGENPLTRRFESNGPDVKVRGTPAHIAEEYLRLARDAQSSGDRVLAENYLQHAEHYSRIIMAYREQFQPAGGTQAATTRRMPGTDGFDLAEDMDSEEGGERQTEDFGGGPQPVSAHANGPAPAQDANGNGPAPQQPRQPYRQEGRQPDNRGDNRPDSRPDGQQNRYDRGGQYDRNNGDNQQRGDRPFRRDGQNNNNNNNNRFRDRNDRNDRNNRPYGGPNQGGQTQGGQNQGDRDRPQEPRFDRGDNRDSRQDRGPRPDRPVRIERPDHGDRAQQPQAHAAQPAFEAPVQSAAIAETTGLPAFIATPAATHALAAAPIAIPAVAPSPAPRRRERTADAAGSDTPDFLKRPVRRPRAAAAAPVDAASPAVAIPPANGGGDEPGSTS